MGSSYDVLSSMICEGLVLWGLSSADAELQADFGAS